MPGPTLTIAGKTVTIRNDTGIRENVPFATGPGAEVGFRCLWGDRYDVIRALIGQSYAVGTSIHRIAPMAYHDSPGMFCLAVPEIVGFPEAIQTQADGWVGYKYADFIAQYGILPYGLDSSYATGRAYCSITEDVGGETRTIPQTTYFFQDGTPSNTPLSFDIAIRRISARFYRVPLYPDVEMDPLVNGVNSAPYRIGRKTYGIGLLRFLGAGIAEEWDSLGNLNYTISYLFDKRPIDWNYEIHPNTGNWTLVTKDGTPTGDPRYPYVDFSPLVG